MHLRPTLLICVCLFLPAPQLALADDSGAGIVGGAVAGAGVGRPVGAVVGGGAGAVVGGVASGTHRDSVVVRPGEPCNAAIEQTTDGSGDGGATQSTNCTN
jgi:hypothetical protein